MFADLHTHSIYSDGYHTPQEICDFAKKANVSLLSITDHDTMVGVEEKRLAAKNAGIMYVDGWEISAYTQQDIKVHITGYGSSPSSSAYLQFEKERVEGSILRAEDCIDKLKKIGIEITLQEIKNNQQQSSTPIHSMHIARAIALKQKIDPFTAYAKYLSIGKPAHSSLFRPTPFDAVRIIHKSGGIACIAHPGRIEMNEEEREKLIVLLKEFGLDGIEAIYPTHTESDTNYFLELAQRYKLLVTGGSDMHKQENRKVGSPAFQPDSCLLNALKIRGN